MAGPIDHGYADTVRCPAAFVGAVVQGDTMNTPSEKPATKTPSKPPPPHVEPRKGEHTAPATPAKPAQPAHATPDRPPSK